MDDSRLGMSSACFYPEETIDAVKRCIGLGFRNVEIFVNSFSELRQPYLGRLGELARASGVRISSLHPFTSGYEYMLFFSAYRKRAADACDFYRMYFGAAAYLGADYVVFHGDSVYSAFIGMEGYCEVLERLRETARSEGVTLAHENVSTARGGDPAFIRELRSRFGAGNMDFVLDIKQALRAGFEPCGMIDAMGSDIVQVHINDWLRSGGDGREDRCRLPFAGDLPLTDIIGRIEDTGFDGRYLIEVYRGNFTDERELAAAGEKLRRL